eukprot:CAMPEP_0194368884 /NCGR_PEP_ID=MMETSP0174-20130528/17116_1 /TAXON_ID=216777 /ORGANISM="Proboscia alata, Strain PI-D3" /LENGTH=44 /DNA_ID= /DNA_START= /DNA_END= /DNA_ORIENTATION=
MAEPTSPVDIPDMPDPIVERSPPLSADDLSFLTVVQLKKCLREA